MLYIQIYPSNLRNASRMLKVATSVHEACDFTETHIVGVLNDDESANESVGPGIRIVRLRGTARKGNIGRILRAVLWQPKVLWRYRKQPVAVVAAHNIWILPMCWMLSRVCSAKLVYNTHELETESVAMSGAKKWIAKYIESRLIENCSIVSVVDESIADWYAKAYPIRRPIVVRNIPRVRDERVNLRGRLGLGDVDLLYIHTGHLGNGRHIPAILEAFAQSSHHVVFLGSGYLEDAVRNASAHHSNIHLLPPVEPDLVVAHVREADVALCLIDHGIALSYRLSLPNKLMEALVADTPPLCTDLVEARRILGDAAQSWIIDDPSRDLCAALERITRNDVATFQATWPGVGTWEDEVRPLTQAYGALNGHA